MREKAIKVRTIFECLLRRTASQKLTGNMQPENCGLFLRETVGKKPRVSLRIVVFLKC